MLRLNIRFIVLVSLLLPVSCSVEKNTNLSRFYHNLTSNYNIYFNGKESFQNGLQRIKDSYQNDYSTILPLFEWTDESAARAATSEMDRAIEKASKLISLHSMTAKPELKSNENLSEKEQEFYDRREFNDWVDDSYLLMGKAQLIKHEFDDARVTLLHNIRESSDEEMKAESIIWLARTYTGMGNFSEANRLLTELGTGSLSQSALADYYLTRADIYMRDMQYEKAIEPLSKAIEYISGKKEKSRPVFILAKLYEENENSPRATQYYKEVLKLNPPYEMEFNARISQAGVFDVESGDVEEIRKELNKLLKDDKNREYRDQIYFAHGNLSMREGKIEEAIEYYRESASSSTANDNQKGRSYLMLAEYYFDKPEYHQAQMYYDSTVTFLDSKYPGYTEYQKRSLNLNELTSYLDIVSREDSLQRVAAMTPSEIDNIINGIIRKIEEEERLSEAATDDRYNLGQFYENQRRFRDNIEASGKWYFYNQSALTFGRTEFRNRWGDRKLEDNWRRRNKSSTGAVIQAGGIEGQEMADSLDPDSDIKSKDYYLKNLPVNDSMLRASDERIANALYNAALVYHEKFGDIEKANKEYTSFLHRFPDHFLVPQALYNMYKINLESDPQLANSYRSQLLNRFPDSEFTRILSDPDYLQRKKEQTDRAEEIYNEAYTAWNNGDTDLAISICDRAVIEFKDSELLPKFMLLKAFSSAPLIERKELKEQLVAIRNGFPGTAEAERAAGMIDFLNRETPALMEAEQIEIASELYDTLDTAPFRFVVVLKNKDLDMNRLTFDAINYNIDNYTNDNYNTRGELVDDRYITITVGIFKDRETALKYFYAFRPEQIFSNTGNTEILTFIIGSKNYDSFISDKDADRYYLFFRENYLD